MPLLLYPISHPYIKLPPPRRAPNIGRIKVRAEGILPGTDGAQLPEIEDVFAATIKLYFVPNLGQLGVDDSEGIGEFLLLKFRGAA